MYQSKKMQFQHQKSDIMTKIRKIKWHYGWNGVFAKYFHYYF